MRCERARWLQVLLLHGKATVSFTAAEASWTLCAGQHVGEWVLTGGTAPTDHLTLTLAAATNCEVVCLGTWAPCAPLRSPLVCSLARSLYKYHPLSFPRAHAG